MERTFDEYARAREYEAETDAVLLIVRGGVCPGSERHLPRPVSLGGSCGRDRGESGLCRRGRSAQIKRTRTGLQPVRETNWRVANLI